MSIESDVITAIQARVDNRAYIGEFPQPPASTGAVARPTWPAARVTVASIDPDVALCGDGGEETADVRIQIDLVVAEGAGYSALTALKSLVLSDMQSFDPPAIWDGGFYDFDSETKTHRYTLDYLIYPSSPEESP